MLEEVYLSRMDSQALLDAITADTASHITFLQSFIRAPSPNPPGDTRQAAAVIAAYLSARGIKHEVIAAKETLDNVVSDFDCGAIPRDDVRREQGEKTGPRLIMNGHMDVFPAGDGAGWDRDPWSGDLVDGRVHGRGGVDMKAGTAASVIAYAYLYRYRAHLGTGASVGLAAVSDEETGGRLGTKWLLEQHEEKVEVEDEKREKGASSSTTSTTSTTTTTTSRGETKKRRRRSRWAGDVVIVAEPGGLQTIRFAEKGTLRLTITVDVGPGAHGAYTHLSPSATRIAARLINDLAVVEAIVPDVDPALRAHLARADVRAALDASMGPGAADLALRCTLNIGTVHGGLKVNMIPGRCVLEADIRMPLGLTAERVLAVVRGVLDRGYPGEARVVVQDAASNPAAASPHDHPMVGMLARQAVRVMGGGGGGGGTTTSSDGEEEKEKTTTTTTTFAPVAVPSMGATDCKHYRYAGVPAYVFGVSPETMGATNESVSVDEFLVVIKTHALAAWEFLGGKL